MTILVPSRPDGAFIPRWPDEVPTLGELVLSWLCHHLPDPRIESQPFTPADWQARRVLRWYEHDLAGVRLWNRVHDEDPKGKGKSPLGAAICIVELRGPVRFAGFARGGEWYACSRYGCSCGWEYAYSPGEPMGIPWGFGGLPAPWVQVGAVSEAQTGNTWGALHWLLEANESRLADWLRLDAGYTLVYWRDRPGSKIERITASAATRTGQPITHALLDEPQEWTPAMGGPMLSKAILANLTKLDGWAHFTGNAPELGKGSVAETLGYELKDGDWEELEAPRVLYLRPRPRVRPRPDMTRDELRPLLDDVYEGTPWTPRERILDDSEDRAAHPWPDTLRLFLNTPEDLVGAVRWIAPKHWRATQAESALTFDATLPVFAAVNFDHSHRTASVAIAQLQDQVVLIRQATFPDVPLPDGQYLELDVIEKHLRSLRQAWPALVWTVRKPNPRMAEQKVPTFGPEVAHNGLYMEGLAQKLRAEGWAMTAVTDGPAFLSPAASTFKGVVEGSSEIARLAHEDDPVLMDHVSRVTSRETPKGWIVGSIDGEPITAARAAMHAVHRALTIPKIPRASQDRRGRRPVEY